MTETVVHVTTLEEWKSVLDVWFEQGYEWFSSGNTYAEKIFKQNSANQLGLVDYGFKYIVCWINNDYDGDNLIEYKQFMEEQQKEDNKMETYYVTQEQLDLVEELKSLPAPLVAIMNKKYGFETLYNELPLTDIEWFSYLSGDNKIELKKEQLYRLWRVNNAENKTYMDFNLGTPGWTLYEEYAFTAPLEEIEKHKTISWEIEEVK